MIELPEGVFYIARHPESESNEQGLFQGGGVDSPLSLRGREEQLPEFLRLVALLQDKPKAILHTGLKRTSEPALRTAERMGIPAERIMAAPGMKERFWGELAGLSNRPPPADLDFDNLPASVETREAFFDRSNGELARVLEANRSHTPVLILGHRGNLDAAISTFGKQFLSKPQNGCIYGFVIQKDRNRPSGKRLSVIKFSLDSYGELRQEPVALRERFKPGLSQCPK